MALPDGRVKVPHRNVHVLRRTPPCPLLPRFELCAQLKYIALRGCCHTSLVSAATVALQQLTVVSLISLWSPALGRAAVVPSQFCPRSSRYLEISAFGCHEPSAIWASVSRSLTVGSRLCPFHWTGMGNNLESLTLDSVVGLAVLVGTVAWRKVSA